MLSWKISMELVKTLIIDVIIVPKDCLFWQPHHIITIITNDLPCKITTQLYTLWECHRAILLSFSIHFLPFILSTPLHFLPTHKKTSFFTPSKSDPFLQLRIRSFLPIFPCCGKRNFSSIGSHINVRRFALFIFIEMRVWGVGKRVDDNPVPLGIGDLLDEQLIGNPELVFFVDVRKQFQLTVFIEWSTVRPPL